MATITANKAAVERLDQAVADYTGRSMISAAEFFDAFLDIRNAVVDGGSDPQVLDLLDQAVGAYSGRSMISAAEFFDAFLDIRNAVSR